MKGTEKQVKWAKDIIDRFDIAVEDFKSTLNSEDSLFHGQEKEAEAFVDSFMEEYKNQHAGFIIDLRNHVPEKDTFVISGKLNVPEFQKGFLANIKFLHRQMKRYDNKGQPQW